MELREIEVSRIILPSNLVREVDGSIVNDLRCSIKEHGLLQPILVRPLHSTDEKYEVVFGVHRLLACKGAELIRIPCFVKDLTANESLLLGLTENVQRLEMNPIKEGEILSKLVNCYDIKLLSDKLGKSSEYIKGRISIHNHLHSDLKVEVGKKITVSNALRLSKLPKERQLEVFKIIEENKRVLEGQADEKTSYGYGYFGTGKPHIDPDSFNACHCPKCGSKHLRGVSMNV